MDPVTPIAPRILILESDRKTRAALRRFAVKGWRGASVQSNTLRLEEAVAEADRLSGFDVVLAGCEFSGAGAADNPTLRALRAMAADPANPLVILLADNGSEYTAVQAIKAGAFDYIPRRLLGREQVVSTIQRALLARHGSRVEDTGRVAQEPLRLFGYDVRRRLVRHDDISLHVAYSAERREEVVLKVLHRGRGALSTDAGFERFLDEFRLLADINDPSVAEIYDFRITPAYCYIAMEYFPRGHLGMRLAAALEPAEALSFAEDIARALSIIHAAGVIHRDLKPSNVMLRAERGVALIDFGISHASFAEGGRQSAQGIRGTPYYISPEQAAGEPASEHTDLYALGIIVYQMLTGTKPYRGETTREILEQHRHAALPRLPAPLAGYQPLLDRLLAKDPAQRMPNARALLEVIEETRRISGAHPTRYPLSELRTEGTSV